MTHRKAVPIKLSQIQETFFVRAELNEGRVQFFREMFEADADVDPIIVTRKTFQLVSGRHRCAGATAAGKEEIIGFLIDEAPLVDLIVEGFKSNVGGPLPPSPADFNHTLRLLLEQGVSRRRILDMLGESTGLPRKLLIRHLDDVQSDMAKTRLARAVEAVTDGGFSVPQAAKEHEVEESTLRARLKGLRTKPELGLDAVKSRLTGKFKGFSSTNAKTAKSLIERFKDGDVTSELVRGVFAHMQHLIRKADRVVADYLNRFEVLTPNPRPVWGALEGSKGKVKQQRVKVSTKPAKKEAKVSKPRRQPKEAKMAKPRKPTVSGLAKMGLTASRRDS